jgi:cobalamin biosynthesis protein CobD/CbiB
MGYWWEVSKRALASSRKAARIESGGAVAVLILSQAILAALLWFLTGDAGLPARIAATALPFLLVLPLYISEFVAMPPQMHREVAEKAERAEKALSESRNRTPDVAKINGMVMRLAQKCLAMRTKHRATTTQQAAWANTFIADIRAILGQEFAYVLRKKYHYIYEGRPTGQDFDRAMRALADEMAEVQKSLTAEKISTEQPNLMAYVDRRLSELRAEQEPKT